MNRFISLQQSSLPRQKAEGTEQDCIPGTTIDVTGVLRKAGGFRFRLLPLALRGRRGPFLPGSAENSPTPSWPRMRPAARAGRPVPAGPVPAHPVSARQRSRDKRRAREQRLGEILPPILHSKRRRYSTSDPSRSATSCSSPGVSWRCFSTDERASRCTLARAAYRADNLGIFPRRTPSECAAADGQRVPIGEVLQAGHPCYFAEIPEPSLGARRARFRRRSSGHGDRSRLRDFAFPRTGGRDGTSRSSGATATKRPPMRASALDPRWTATLFLERLSAFGGAR